MRLLVFKLCTSGFGQFISVLPTHPPQVSSDWIGVICELPPSGVSIRILWGLSGDFRWITQRQTDTCPEAIPVLSWLYASVHCCSERWTITPVSGHLQYSRVFVFPRTSLYLASIIPPSILSSLPVCAIEKSKSNCRNHKRRVCGRRVSDI